MVVFASKDWLSVWSSGVAPFANHVIVVVLGGSQPQMIRIDAIPNIAGMTNKHAGLYGAVKDFIGDAMRSSLPPIKRHQSVTVGTLRSGPYRTLTYLFRSLPERSCDVVA